MGCRSLRFVLVVITLCAVGGLLVCGPSYGNGQQAVDDPYSQTPSLNILQPLDEAENPFKDQYTELDRWIDKHKVATSIGLIATLLAPADNKRTVITFVSVEGHQLPVAEYYRICFEESATSFADSPDVFADRTVLYARGPDEAWLGEAIDRAQYYQLSKHLPPVPAWLLADLPKSAMFMPNGDVITTTLIDPWGQIPAAMKSAYEKREDASGVFCRYDGGGQLVSAVPSGCWFQCYLPVGYWPEGTGQIRSDGYVVFRGKTGAVTEVLDFDGKPIQRSVEPAPRSTYCFQMFSKTEIQSLYVYGDQ